MCVCVLGGGPAVHSNSVVGLSFVEAEDLYDCSLGGCWQVKRCERQGQQVDGWMASMWEAWAVMASLMLAGVREDASLNVFLQQEPWGAQQPVPFGFAAAA